MSTGCSGRLAGIPAELHLVGGGHTGGPEMTDRLIAATDRFAR